MIRVLLVEDDEDDYLIVRDLLTLDGVGKFTLTWADNYENGLHQLTHKEFDICLVDYRLGAHKGTELIHAARMSCQNYPPMIMLTGQASSQNDIEALTAGAADYLEKGRIDSALLERAIRYAIERQRVMHALDARENELRIITNELDDGLLVTDLEHNILFANPAAKRLLGRSEGEKVLEPFRFPFRHNPYEFALERQNQSIILDVHHSEAQWHGKQVNVLALHDISLRKQAEMALRMSEERYALAAEGANDGLWDWDLKLNRIYFSPRWLDMAGFTPDIAIDEPAAWFELVHEDDIAGLKRTIDEHLRGKTAHLKYTYRLKHKEGGYRWMLCRGRAVADTSGVPYRLAGSQSDITRQKDADAQLRHDMLHDSLTGLPNPKMFQESLGALLKVQAQGALLRNAILLIDLDDFKVVNDSLGHIYGDRLLTKVGRRLKSCLQPGDLLARLGGDEFAIILSNIVAKHQATQYAQRILSVLARPFNLEGHEVFVSSSIGIAMLGDEYRSADELLRDVDIAMYRAKHAGKNSFAVFSNEMHQQAIQRLRIETELRRALSDNQLVPFFQPIVELETQKIAGFETLVRWQHPGRGLVSPNEFIPICEETGLIVQVGEQVLEKACETRSLWSSQLTHCRDTYISVNLCPRQMNSSNLPELVQQMLEKYALEPHQLRMEITETALMDNSGQALQMLTSLRDLGVQIYLDDFGTGYSSLSYLHAFPIDVLKIDKSFVDRIELPDGKARKIIEVILNLAKTLDINVVAEGVETVSQLELLRSLGCAYGQGYLFSRPVNAGHALDLITRGIPSADSLTKV